MRSRMIAACLVLIGLAASRLSAREASSDAYKLPEKNTVIVEKTDLAVSKVYRLSHPDYEIPHSFIINHDPWNKDRQRIVFLEEKGRGPVWGNVDQLKEWQTKADYLALAKNIFDGYVYRTYPAESMFWSVLDGEESILYGICTTTKKVIRIDVDRPAATRMTDVASYVVEQAGADADEAAANTIGAYGRGWTKDGQFVVVYRDRQGKEHGGVLVDVRNGNASYFATVPVWNKKPANPTDNDAWRAFPRRSSQHGARSPSGKYYAKYNGSASDGVWNTEDGSFIKDAEVNVANPDSPLYPYTPMYMTWRATDDWYIVTTLGDSQCKFVDGKKTYINLEKGEKPALWPNEIFQVYLDKAAGVCRYRKLLTYYTTGHWTNKYSEGPNAEKTFTSSNYHGHGIPVLRNDGRQLLYCAHENNYSSEDLRLAKAAGLDTAYMDGKVSGVGLFLVEFKTAEE